MILSIDPSYGKGYSYAVFCGTDCVHFGTFKKAKDNSCLNVVNVMIGTLLCSPFDIETVVIEDQYLARSNPDTLKKLTEARTIAEVIMHQVFNADVIRINAKTWQTILGVSKTTRSEVIKECSKAYAKSYTGKEITSDDEADAICIGSFYVNNFKVHGDDIYTRKGVQKVYSVREDSK